MTRDDVEWLDERDSGADIAEETLAAGSRRPPLRRRTRILLGAAGVAVVAAAVTVGIATAGGDPRPGVTRTVAPIPSSERTFALEPVPAPLPGRAPAPALAAIEAAFPGADLTSFVAATSPGTDGSPSLIYNLSLGSRTITVSVRPVRPTDSDASNRGARSIELIQQLGNRTVSVLVRRSTGPTTDRDYLRVQRLIRDARLLAT